jgi:uncharacterized protein (DUF433 family)
MSIIEQVVDLLRRMDRRDKARLLSIVARDPDMQFPGITLAPGVCGGAPRLLGTRIPVWLLEGLRQDGASDQDLLAAYPQLRSDQLAHAWAFVGQNRELVQEEIDQNEAE